MDEIIFFVKGGFSNEKVVILQPQNTAIVAQLVRVPDCGSVGRRFESDLSPPKSSGKKMPLLFFVVPIGTKTVAKKSNKIMYLCSRKNE